MSDTRARLMSVAAEYATIEAPFDSGDFPKSILLPGDDLYDTRCGGFSCNAHVSDWPDAGAQSAGGKPGAMYQADIYCSDCLPISYDEYTGKRVRTLTGEPTGPLWSA